MDINKINLQSSKIELLENFVDFLEENWKDKRTYLKIAFSDFREVCPLLSCFDDFSEGEDDEYSSRKKFVEAFAVLLRENIERLKENLKEMVK